MQKINCQGTLLDLSIPKVMGIINLNNDSFYAKSRVSAEKELLIVADSMINQGVDILDLGYMTSKPGSPISKAAEELPIIYKAIHALRRRFNVLLSVDTVHAQVAKSAIDHGANIINDISAGDIDPDIINVCSSTKTPYIAMHMQGVPATMQNNPTYSNPTAEIIGYFGAKIEAFKIQGLTDVIIDPGFGFGKTLDHSYQLLKDLSSFAILEKPILVGISRKSMIYKSLKISADEALNGTTALNTIALLKGANILRVHDVAPAVEVVKLYQSMHKN